MVRLFAAACKTATLRTLIDLNLLYFYGAVRLLVLIENCVLNPFASAAGTKQQG